MGKRRSNRQLKAAYMDAGMSGAAAESWLFGGYVTSTESPNELDGDEEATLAALMAVEDKLTAYWEEHEEECNWLLTRTLYGDNQVDGVNDLRQVPGYPPARLLVRAAMDEAK